MSKQQIYVLFHDDKYRIFKSHETITVDESDTIHFRVECTNPDRTLFFNKGAVTFIDIGPVEA